MTTLNMLYQYKEHHPKDSVEHNICMRCWDRWNPGMVDLDHSGHLVDPIDSSDG